MMMPNALQKHFVSYRQERLNNPFIAKKYVQAANRYSDTSSSGNQAVFKRNHDQHIAQTNKPKYNFTYGLPQSNRQFEQSTGKNQKIPIQDPKIKSHIQFFDENSQKKVLDFQQLQIHHRNSIWNKSRSPSRKKNLKIFPQKFVNSSLIPQNKENKEIVELKQELIRLKKQIESQTQNRQIFIKTDTVQSGLSKIQKLEAERTKRLSDLNTFNESLFTELAEKLKEISKIQYQKYLEQSKYNKQFLESVFQHSGAHYQSPSPHKTNYQVSEDFMDNNQFERQYQKTFPQNKYSQSLKQSPNQKHYQTLKIEDITEKQPSGQVYSPFSLKENYFSFSQKKPNQKQKAFQENTFKGIQTSQQFTFNKPILHKRQKFEKYPYQAKKFNKSSQNPILRGDFNRHKGQIEKKDALNQPAQQKDAKATTRLSVKLQKGRSKEIKDLNRDIEQKIMRKRFVSQYAVLDRNRKIRLSDF